MTSSLSNDSLSHLIELLSNANLIPSAKRTSAEQTARQFLGATGAIESDTASHVLHAVAQPVHGVISHDYAFWNETVDVVKEFSDALRMEPIEMHQVAILEGEQLTLRVQVEGESCTMDIDLVPGGLDSVAHQINAWLRRAQSPRRLVALETRELDWKVFVAVNKDVEAALQELGQTRPLRPD